MISYFDSLSINWKSLYILNQNKIHHSLSQCLVVGHSTWHKARNLTYNTQLQRAYALPVSTSL